MSTPRLAVCAAALISLQACGSGTVSNLPSDSGTQSDTWTADEVEPNDVDHNGLGGIESWTGAQALPSPSGDGLTDQIVGALGFDSVDPKYSGDNDGYTFVPEFNLAVTATAAWDGDDQNMDLYLYDDDGELVAAGTDLGDTNPEVIDGVAAAQTLTAGRTYILVLAAWTGAPGPTHYTVDLTWTAEPE